MNEEQRRERIKRHTQAWCEIQREDRITEAAPTLLACLIMFVDAIEMTSNEFAEKHGTKAEPGKMIDDSERFAVSIANAKELIARIENETPA